MLRSKLRTATVRVTQYTRHDTNKKANDATAHKQNNYLATSDRSRSSVKDTASAVPEEAAGREAARAAALWLAESAAERS